MLRRPRTTGTYAGICAGALALGIAATFAVPAAEAAFPEKDIHLVIPYGPGGGFDVFARAVAPALEKYLPNKVNVVPRNIVGGGGQKGASDVFRAKPDGYTIGIFNNPIQMMQQIAADNKLAYDFRRATWLVGLSQDRYAIAVKADSPIKTAADLFELGRKPKFTATNTDFTAIALNTMKLDGDIITGYPSGAAYMLAVVRGDGDATLNPIPSFNKLVQAGDLKLILTFEMGKSSVPGVQSAEEAGFPDLSKIYLERLIGGPPDMAEEPRRILETALAKAVQDADFKAWSEKTQMPLHPQTAAEAKASVLEQYRYYEANKAMFAQPGKH